ncbi:MAG: acetyl-CoA carboxylase biotin carboxyl carrier protein [Bacteroidota bacterium]
MDLSRIRELLAIVAESDVSEVEIEEDGLKLVIRKQASVVTMMPPMPMGYPPAYPAPAYGPAPLPGPAPVVPAIPAAPPPSPEAPAAAPSGGAEPKGVVQRAPIVGTFYSAPAPDADPFVKIGDRVAVGDVLCIIEAMKLMNEIEAETAGTVREIKAQNAEPVEYDQPLFVIEPA